MAEGNESQPSTSSSSSSSSIEWSQPCRPFEFSEILLATGNFSESLVIGHGGFGKVFKGNVINGSSVVVAAFKRLDSMSSQGASEFWAEVKMLSKLRHCHLVSLFGYCNHEKEMIIIYEYMPNGTLEDHLHKLGTPLSWLQRLKICIGTARGLDYLHTGTGIEFGVIHRDVKSSNILLQDNWAAKISDFGLSKIGVTNKPSTYVKTLVKGTFGYLDPNYFTTGRLTRKSDVYSFGVVLLEVLCRKRAVDRSLDEEQWGLVPFVQESIKQGSLKSIIDSGIRDQISQKCLKEFLRIAERCLHNNPKQRPAMAEVVVALDSVLTLQQKTDNSSGRTIYGRMLDIFPFPFHGENSANNESRLSSNSKDNKDSVVSVPSLNVFNFSDLEKITKNFSQDMLVDRDGYSEVFLGWVDKKTFAPSTKGVGITVAVKKYNEGLPEWEAVVASLGRLAHPNIISLLGYGDVNRLDCLLVYNYTNMQNQNFSRFLFGDVVAPLSWETRLMIMIGVARGLAYMHSSPEQVIHGGIKTFNIFLDQNSNAKLGYFGLAKFRPKIPDFNDVEVDTTKHDMDTLRYLDQRDQRTGQLTVKSDIYSFGVVLFETLTGQRAWEPKFGFTLVKWARPFLADRGKIKDIIDQCLNQNYPLQGAFECVALATRCVATNREARPSSEEVLQSLERIFLTSIG
ncbi:receptor-like protein kinase HERK 1 [Lactuca sativa]|uniref:Protein kinase domain-containing protein n=1 Tax=Lactuca sativa TaxID=4236 RepID=A0A9R1UXT7_LACSA|nr:receptor-like protein kinase HERK 1 [Lactuca sativa]KAJ0196177.1 hypothetical protein LSAT_V11C700364140 [Lactuca sativa]